MNKVNSAAELEDSRTVIDRTDDLGSNVNKFITPDLPPVRRNDGKREYRGIEKNSEIVLRLAVIDNPELNRPSPIGMDPTDVGGVVNDSTGKVCLRWLGMSGGVVNPGPASVKQPEVTSYNPEDRKLSETATGSEKELVPLTYPFLWVGTDNWCGYNYLPPIGAKVIVGFSKNGYPQILGYLNPHYKICTPYLRPGEVVHKGYGNNYVHLRQSNKLDVKVWANAGDADVDDPTGEKTAAADCTLWVRMDADNGHLEISANDTIVYVTPDSIGMTVGGKTSLTLTSDTVAITTSKFSLNSQMTDMNGGRISHN